MQEINYGIRILIFPQILPEEGVRAGLKDPVIM
jgi:hypothetical protein